jgi:hypothetical protein
MDRELVHHLEKVNNKSLIGLCIQQMLKREEELTELLTELKDISKENPEAMKRIIGEEAYNLLTE